MKFLLVLTCYATIAIGNSEKVELEIEQGTLRGFSENSLNGNGIYSFLGIPYAMPPVGRRRLRNPVPVRPWEGILEADKEREGCAQFSERYVLQNQLVAEGQEDCLYLNVYTPKPKEPEAKLPVMVFIHGGGYTSGTAKAFNPYVLLNEDVVLIVIQYRLGAFGFLSNEDFIMSGNYGLKDQIMALKWVQNNIAQFGGDPGKVTIFGESAGAGSVHLLMLSPWSEGLFHRVIAQSGTAVCPWSVTREAKKTSKKFGEAIGCPSQDTDNYLNCLQSKDTSAFLEAEAKLREWALSHPLLMAPRIDGDFIPDEPTRLIKDGKYNKVDFISGVTKDEGLIFTAFIKESVVNDLVSGFDELADVALFIQDNEGSEKAAKKIFDHYLEGRILDTDSFYTLDKMYSDGCFQVCHEIATQLHALDPEINVFRYQLDWPGQMSLVKLLNISGYDNTVPHGNELFYMFSGGPLFAAPLETKEDLKLREIFTKLWTNFAATGNPTPDKSLGFTWKPSTPSDFRTLRITPEPYMSDYVHTKAVNFWSTLPIKELELYRDFKSTIAIGAAEKDEL